MNRQYPKQPLLLTLMLSATLLVTACGGELVQPIDYKSWSLTVKNSGFAGVQQDIVDSSGNFTQQFPVQQDTATYKVTLSDDEVAKMATAIAAADMANRHNEFWQDANCADGGTTTLGLTYVEKGSDVAKQLEVVFGGCGVTPDSYNVKMLMKVINAVTQLVEDHPAPGMQSGKPHPVL